MADLTALRAVRAARGRAAVILVAATALAAGTVCAATVSAAAAAPHHHSVLRAGQTLPAGASLVSPDGRYRATMQTNGRLIVRRGGRELWATHPRAPHARLKLLAGGSVEILAGRHVVWSAGTAGAGRDTRLALGDDGSLSLRSPGGIAWSTRIGNRCRHDGGSGRRIVVDISQQFAWACRGHQQLLTTPVTTGAVDLGDATPTGTWHVQGKQRDRYLYPAAGGAYFVHYWMPYDGDYGFHDAPWQKFAYGSGRYRAHGSHGCVHVPAHAMRRLFDTTAIGTTVHVRG